MWSLVVAAWIARVCSGWCRLGSSETHWPSSQTLLVNRCFRQDKKLKHQSGNQMEDVAQIYWFIEVTRGSYPSETNTEGPWERTNCAASLPVSRCCFTGNVRMILFVSLSCLEQTGLCDFHATFRFCAWQSVGFPGEVWGLDRKLSFRVFPDWFY